jgi:hypothetical protein
MFAGYCASFSANTVNWITKKANSGKLAMIQRKILPATPAGNPANFPEL